MQQGRSGSAAGVLIAISLIIGTVVGTLRGEPSIGMIGGFAVGAVLATLSTWLARRK